MVNVRFQTNAKQWEAKFKEASVDLRKNETFVLRDVARLGYTLTKGISPYKTGALRKAIVMNQGKDWFEIVSNQPQRSDIRGQVPYHLWMHGIGRYNTSARIKSGTPTYMFATATALYALFHTKLDIALSATIKKNFN